MPQTSESRHAYITSYRQNHKEEIAARGAAYYQENKEEKRAYGRTYSRDHREEIAVYRSAYDIGHKEEKRTYNAAYYESNRDSILADKAAAYPQTHGEESARFTAWLQTLRTVNGCADCETHEGRLVHHHADPSTKKYNVSDMWSYSLDALEDELEKCVVLCEPCHKASHKTLRAVKREELLAIGRA